MKEGRVLPRHLRVSTLSAVAVLGLCTAARAQLTAYEPFDYPPGNDLLGESGGGSFGFASPWAAGGFNASFHDNYELAADSLTFQQLLTSGGRVPQRLTSVRRQALRPGAGTPPETPGGTRPRYAVPPFLLLTTR